MVMEIAKVNLEMNTYTIIYFFPLMRLLALPVHDLHWIYFSITTITVVLHQNSYTNLQTSYSLLGGGGEYWCTYLTQSLINDKRMEYSVNFT